MDESINGAGPDAVHVPGYPAHPPDGVPHRFENGDNFIGESLFQVERAKHHRPHPGRLDRLLNVHPVVDDIDDLWSKVVWRATAWTVDGYTKKWVERDLNHLILAENITQAVASDLLRHGMFNVEEADYPIILHVHDEIVSLVDEGFGSIGEFMELMCDAPDWAAGLPMKASGWEGERFRK